MALEKLGHLLYVPPIMQRGSAEIFLGLGLIIIGILGLKLTDLNLFWAAIALGAAVGCHGGVSVSTRARV